MESKPKPQRDQKELIQVPTSEFFKSKTSECQEIVKRWNKFRLALLTVGVLELILVKVGKA